MSRAAKSFLVGSILATSLTVWGVHFIQERERLTMYEGVVKDEARVAAKRASQISAQSNPINPVSPDGLPIPSTSLAARRAEYERNLKLQEELAREQGLKKSGEERRKLEIEREAERRNAREV